MTSDDPQTISYSASVSSSGYVPLVAVLCVASNSVYKSMDAVEAFDPSRDARSFQGGVPVVAHPPCRAWSTYCAHQAKPAPGEKDLGPMCVEWVRECGGILEHPAHSRLWDRCGMPKLGEPGGNEWSIKVSQAWWGDSRTKETWLFVSGIEPRELPQMPFALHSPHGDRRRWQLMSKHQRSATHPNFALWLVETARRVYSHNAPADRPQ